MMNNFASPPIECAIGDLFTALRAIPQHEKLEYLQALRVAPPLVEMESNPLAFLRYCDWNATAAARRLVSYWRKRVELFGEARAYLPILNDFSGNGALGKDEIEILRGGGCCVMPNDTHGRSVGYFDRSSCPPRLLQDHKAKLRVSFALFQQMTAHHTALSQTPVCVFVIRGLQTADSSTIAKKIVELIHEVFPLRVDALHIIYIREDNNGFQQGVVAFLLQHFGRFFTDKTFIHRCESGQQCAERMAVRGITRASLPHSMGGFAGTDGTLEPTARGLQVGESRHQQAQLSPLLRGEIFNLGVDGNFELLETSEKAGPSIRHEAAQDIDSEPLPFEHTHMQSPNEDPQPSEKQPTFHGINDMIDGHLLGSSLEASLIQSPLGRQQHADIHSFDLGMLDPNPIKELELPVTAVLDPRRQNPNVNVNKSHLGMEVSPLNEVPGTASIDRGEGFHQPSHMSQQQVAAQPRVDGDGFVETRDMVERGLVAINEAVGRLPDHEQSAYNEAVRKSPLVVQTESDPVKYLRFAKFDTWAAAKRLAAYWEYRVQYFGDKAFLPLVQIEGGALWEEDLRTLNAGALFFLPPDSKGRPVLCFDLAKCPAEASKPSRIRVAMYFFSILCNEYPVAMTEGCLVLGFVSNGFTGLPNLDGITNTAIDIALDSFPTKICEAHIIYRPPPAVGPELYFTRFVLPVLLHAIGRLLTNGRAHFHVGDTHDELGRDLALSGLSGQGLVAAVNGGISEDDFAQWIQSRQVSERQRSVHDVSQQPLPLARTQGTTGTIADGDNQVTLEARSASPIGLQDINKAMELVPAGDKRDYLEALKEAPDLVKEESDPGRFLKSENYNALDAARKLAAYWRIRRELFQERALLPMDQTNDGALNRKDTVVLHSSFLMQLPNDLGGHSVICCDGSRLTKSPSDSSHLRRIFFYMWSLVAQNDLSQSGGYSVLYTMTNPTFDRACRSCLELAMDTHPVRLKCFHLLGCCPEGTSELNFHHQGPVRDMMKLLDQTVQDKVIVHVCESRAGFATKLGAHGMSRDRLPKPFGGNWGLEDFVLWQELRIRYEWDLPIKGSLHKVAESYSIHSSIIWSVSSLSEDEKMKRQRRLNVVHSKSKRERTRLELLVLQEQCSVLREEQKVLLREGRRLEELHQRAQAIAKENY